MKINRKEAEMVDGTWFKYFHKVLDPVFSNKTYLIYEQLLEDLYGNFFDRNLDSDKGKLLSLGAGFGLTEIPLARKGYRIIGIDNDTQVLKLLEENAKNYSNGNLEAKFGDLYNDFHKEYFDKNIQACISFGVLEHFTKKDLDALIKKQFLISPLIICMMPVKTPNTLKAFKAEKQPFGHIDENGIYRNFWSKEYWEKEIFYGHKIINRCDPKNTLRENGKKVGEVDMVTYAIKK